MLLRLAFAQRRIPDLIVTPSRGWTAARILIPIACVWLLAAGACRRPATDDVDVRWTLAPPRPQVGPVTLTVTVGGPHAEAREVRVVGHMTHPGMTPVVATTTRRGRGVHDATMNLTMAGDWVLLVTVQLADGRRVERRVDVRGVQPPPS